MGEFELDRLPSNKRLPKGVACERMLVSILKTDASQTQAVASNPEPLVVETYSNVLAPRILTSRWLSLTGHYDLKAFIQFANEI